MPTPFESAQLILTLYEQRREETMRKARDFWAMFDPETMDDFMATMFGPQSGYVRMVMSYWDMAASLVTFGAIDAEMFRAGNGEIVATFAKVEPFLAKLRETSGIKDLAHHMETVVRAMPGSTERLARLKQQFQAAAEAKDDKKGKRAKRR